MRVERWVGIPTPIENKRVEKMADVDKYINDNPYSIILLAGPSRGDGVKTFRPGEGTSEEWYSRYVSTNSRRLGRLSEVEETDE